MFNTPFAFMAAGAPADADATAYLAAVVAAGGTVDATITTATNTLFTDMKTAGVYAKMDAFWPVLGGVAGSHKINANLNATYDLTYNGTWTHNSAGQDPGDTSWANTGYAFGVDDYDNSFGVYVTTSASVNVRGSDMGTSNEAVPLDRYYFLSIRWTAIPPNVSRFWNVDRSFFGSSPEGGLMINTRTAINNCRFYVNNTLEQTDTNNASSIIQLPNIALGAINGTGDIPPANYYGGRNEVFAFVGQGLSDAQAVAYSIAINTFQTTLGRNTY
jgi:hypothetical protein